MLAEKQLRQRDAALALNLSRMAVSRRLAGDTPFSAEELIKISGICQVPVAVFFGELAA